MLFKQSDGTYNIYINKLLLSTDVTAVDDMVDQLLDPSVVDNVDGWHPAGRKLISLYRVVSRLETPKHDSTEQ